MDNAVTLFTGAFIGGLISAMVNLYLWPAIVLGLLLYKLRKLALLLAGLWGGGVTWFHSKLMHDLNMTDPAPAAMAGDYASAIMVAMLFALIGTVLGDEAVKKIGERKRRKRGAGS